jgi:uncharacterized delta-60 repeat protein
MALQPDGKILVTGWSDVIDKGTLSGDMALLRYNANGTLDKTFNGSGIVTTGFGKSSSDEAGAVLVQPADGKIVIAGRAGTDLGLARYNTNGSLDASFGSGGLARFHMNGVIAEPDSGFLIRMVLQPDGRLDVSATISVLTAPNTYDNFALLARVNSNGTLDGSFGSGGVVVAALGQSLSQPLGLALQPDGKLVVAGVSSNPRPDLALARFNGNGTADSSFNGNGLMVLDISVAPYNADTHYFQNSLTDVAVQGDGKIVAAGVTETGNIFAQPYSRFALLRVNSAGGVDPTFGNAGLVLTDVTPGGDSPNAVVIQSDGKILLGGSGLARYLPSAPQIGSFTASAYTVASGSSLTLTATNITDGNPGSSVTQVAFYAQVNGSNTLLGYGTQSSPGTWTFTFTVSLAPGTYTLFAQATDTFGALGDLAALTLTVQ